MLPDVLFVRPITPAAPPLLPAAPELPAAVMVAVVMPVRAVMVTLPALPPMVVAVPPLAITFAASATRPVLAVMLMLPALPSAAPVELMVLVAPVPVTLAPRRVMPPACADRAAFSVKLPPPMLSASARKLMLPARVTLMPALTVILLLASRRMLLPGSMVTALLTKMSFVACRYSSL